MERLFPAAFAGENAKITKEYDARPFGISGNRLSTYGSTPGISADGRTQEEDERRVLLRDEIKTHNKHLASAAKDAGVREGLDFAIFQTEGYKGLYGGLDVPGIRRRKRLTPKQAILGSGPIKSVADLTNH